MCGYFANVSRIEPTAKGAGSTSSAAPLAARRDRGAVAHVAVGERRAVLDDEHALAADLLRVARR